MWIWNIPRKDEISHPLGGRNLGTLTRPYIRPKNQSVWSVLVRKGKRTLIEGLWKIWCIILMGYILGPNGCLCRESILTKNQSAWPVTQFLGSLNHLDQFSKRINFDNYGVNFGPNFRVFLGQSGPKESPPHWLTKLNLKVMWYRSKLTILKF